MTDHTSLVRRVLTRVVGREREVELVVAALAADRHVLLEGPVGVGKTFLVSAIAELLGKKVVRVDGDSRYTEQKLTGWFDPPTVLKKGYGKDSYFDGPLAEAMREGAILFVNELNTIPGFTSISMYPKMWEHSGLAFGALLDRPLLG